MPHERRRVIIVGAGHAGGVAAVGLRDAGFGGDITLVGREPWPPYERPPLSKDLLAGRIDVPRTFLRPAEDYAARGIDLRLNSDAVRIERNLSRLILGDGKALRYDTLVLATGGRVRTLTCPGADNFRVHYLRDMAQCLRLREQLVSGARIVIVGAGLIGLEIAASARERGCSVTVVEQAAQPLARALPPQIGELFATLHRSRGVTLHMQTVVTSIEERGSHVVMHTDRVEEIDADLVVVGIGILPDTALAEASGLEVSDGIVTDEFGRTSDPSIVAVGDVARSFDVRLGRHRRLETWQNAQNQALAIARIVAGADVPYSDVPWFWTDQFTWNFQFTGDTDGIDQTVWRGQPGKGSAIGFHLTGKRVVGASCFNPGRDMRSVKAIVARRAMVGPRELADATVPLTALAA